MNIKTRKIKAFRFICYGGFGCTGYKIQYNFTNSGTIRIRETQKYDDRDFNRDLINTSFRKKKKSLEILSYIEDNVLEQLIQYYNNEIFGSIVDAGTYTIQITFTDDSKLVYEKVSPNQYIEQIENYLNECHIDHPSLHWYKVQYLVRSLHTLDQKLLTTDSIKTKEHAIEQYTKDARKYVVLGIMRLYQADILTVNALSGKQIKKEYFVNNSSEFWNEYYNK